MGELPHYLEFLLQCFEGGGFMLVLLDGQGFALEILAELDSKLSG